MAGWRARVDLKDFVSGVLFMLVAAGFAYSALKNLSLGSARHMGPGYFPLIVAAALAFVGAVVALRAFAGRTEAIEIVGWRAFLLVMVAPAIYALAIAPLGFVPAIAMTTAAAAWASHMMSVRFSVLLTFFLTALCAVIFVYLLKMPVLLVGPWLQF
jgi:hypothetical protein